MVLNGDLRLFHLTVTFLLFEQTGQTLIRRHVLIRVCTVCQCASPGLAENAICTALWRSQVSQTRYRAKKKKKKKKKKKQKINPKNLASERYTAEFLYIQSNLDGSNTDGSFTMANSNSVLSPYEILPIAQENKYLRKFSYFIGKLYVACIH